MPKGIEVVLRENDPKRLWFIINHADKKRTLENPPAGMNLITGKTIAGDLELEANGVAVIMSK